MRIVTLPFAYCRPTIRILQACNSHIVFFCKHSNKCTFSRFVRILTIILIYMGKIKGFLFAV